MEFKQIGYEKDPETGIVQVTMNRPKIKNALGVLMLLDLYHAAEAVENDETAHAMILTGAVSPDNTIRRPGRGSVSSIRSKKRLR